MTYYNNIKGANVFGAAKNMSVMLNLDLAVNFAQKCRISEAYSPGSFASPLEVLPHLKRLLWLYKTTVDRTAQM